MTAIIEVDKLTKSYGRRRGIADVSFEVSEGEVFGFLGPNGAGKTTAVKLLLGLVRPSSGEAMVLGAPAGDRETRRRCSSTPISWPRPNTSATG